MCYHSWWIALLFFYLCFVFLSCLYFLVTCMRTCWNIVTTFSSVTIVILEHVIAGCGKLLEKYRSSEKGITPYGERKVFIFIAFLLKLGKRDLMYKKNNSFCKSGVPAVEEDLMMKSYIMVHSGPSRMTWRKFWWVVYICSVYVFLYVCVDVCTSTMFY